MFLSRAFRIALCVPAVAALGCAAQADPPTVYRPVPGPPPDLSSQSLDFRYFNARLLQKKRQVDVVLAGDSILAVVRLPDVWWDGLAINRSIGGDHSTNLRRRFAEGDPKPYRTFFTVCPIRSPPMNIRFGPRGPLRIPPGSLIRYPQNFTSEIVHSLDDV